MFEKVIEMGMLYDFYGPLLTEKQREIMHLYFEDDYSLSEIGDNMNISRQAVHDTIKKSEKSLHEYEEKLALVKRYLESEKACHEINETIDKLTVKFEKDLFLTEQLNHIKQLVEIVDCRL